MSADNPEEIAELRKAVDWHKGRLNMAMELKRDVVYWSSELHRFQERLEDLEKASVMGKGSEGMSETGVTVTIRTRMMSLPTQCAGCEMLFDTPRLVMCCATKRAVLSKMERPDWCPLQEFGEDQMTDFYRLLYSWEDARDEHMKCFGQNDFDQVDEKVKAAAAVKAKADLVEFVKGLGR